MTKRTQGPWEVRKPLPGFGWDEATVEAPDASFLAQVVCRLPHSAGTDVMYENGRLIAAAPDLLAALEMVERDIHANPRDARDLTAGIYEKVSVMLRPETFAALRAALAKAGSKNAAHDGERTPDPLPMAGRTADAA